jgi:hypothetical protein
MHEAELAVNLVPDTLGAVLDDVAQPSQLEDPSRILEAVCS